MVYGVDSVLDRFLQSRALKNSQAIPTTMALNEQPVQAKKPETTGTLVKPPSAIDWLTDIETGKVTAKSLPTKPQVTPLVEHQKETLAMGSLPPQAQTGVPTDQRKFSQEDFQKAQLFLNTMLEKPVMAFLTAPYRPNGVRDRYSLKPSEYLPGGAQYQAYEEWTPEQQTEIFGKKVDIKGIGETALAFGLPPYGMGEAKLGEKAIQQGLEKFASEQVPKIAKFAVGEMVKDAEGKLYKVLDVSDPSLLKVKTASGKEVNIGKSVVNKAEAEAVTPPPVQSIPQVGGQVPPSPPPPNELKTVEDMWAKGREPVKNISDLGNKVMEQINDIYYGLRRMQTRVSKVKPIEEGGSEDLITGITNAPGAANAGATRYILAINEIKKIAPDIAVDDINTIIYSTHAKEVLTEKGVGRVMAGGFKDTAQLDNVLAQLKTKLGDANYAKAEQASKIVTDIYATELQRMVDSGLVSKEVAEVFRQKYPNYNPLRYVEFIEDLIAKGKNIKPYTVAKSGVERLTSEGTAKEAVAPLNVLGEQLIKNEVRIQKNNIAKSIIKLASEDPALKINGIAKVKEGGENTLSFFENGERQIYKVPDFIYREAETLTKTIQHPIISMIGALNGISRAAFTTFSPVFVVSNMLNDLLPAFMRGGILPHETVATLVRSVRGLEKDPIMQAFRLSGGYQMRFYGKSAKQLAEEAGVASGKVITDTKSLLAKIKDAIPTAGELGEQATRMAGFRKELNKTLPMWKSMTPEQIAATPQGRKAAANAVELTINFGRGGYLVKNANPLVIFLNANMEAMKLPFRTLRDNPASRWRLAGALAGLTGLIAYNMSYPEYFDVPDAIRWGSMVVMLPSKEKDTRGNPKPNYVIIIPKTREWAIFFGSSTYGMEKMFKDSPDDFGKFSKVISPMILPLGFGAIPVPEVLNELFEQRANYDFYWSQPIVPQELQGLPPEQQVQPYVSRTMQEVTNLTGQSPLRVQHAWSGLLGGAGQALTSVTDVVINLLSPKQIDPRIQQLTEQYQTITDRTAKNEFLYGLSIEDRDKVLEQLKQPQKGIPIVTPLIKRVYPERGGQKYQTGLEQAQKATGLSTQQTQEATAQLRQMGNYLEKKQEKYDNEVRNGNLTMPEWRELHKELSVEYAGAVIMTGIEFPSSLQATEDKKVWSDYYNAIYTLASTIPDIRTKAELLVAGWNSIAPVETTPGKIDWDTFFNQREEYKKGLAPEDKDLLDRELKSRMTLIEKAYYDATSDPRINEYYGIPEQYIKLRIDRRKVFPDLDAKLNLAGLASSVQSAKALDLLKKYCSEYGIPFDNMPAFQSWLTRKR